MTTTRKCFIVTLLISALLCLSAVFFDFQPKPAVHAATVTSRVEDITSDTTWVDKELIANTTYRIKEGVTLTITGKIKAPGDSDSIKYVISGGTIKFSGEGQYGDYFEIERKKTFTFDGVTIDGEGKEYTNPFIRNGNSGTIINLNNCTLKNYKIKKGNYINSSIIKLFGSTLNITNSTITGCKSSSSMGIIYAEATSSHTNKINITSSNITDNESKICYVGKADVTIDSGTFENNKGGNGGLISANKSYDVGSTVTINGGTFKNNSATNGGVILNSESTVTINGGSFENNSATSNGGVIYNSAADSKVNLYGGYFADNTANGSLNDIYNYAEASIDLNIGSANVPARRGYTYGGWKDNNGNIYNKANQLYSVSGADNGLTVIWNANSYTINYSGMEGATLSPMPTAHVYGTDTAIADPTKTGYTFNGWEVNGAAAVKNLTLGATDYINVISLQATWTANKYTVTFDMQKGMGDTSSVTATYDGAMPAITLPKRTGYTFKGYYTAANGGGTQYYTASGSSARNYDIASAKTLYAYWTANTYTVTFDKQEGTGGTSSATATYDEEMPAITLPKRTGYIFNGYYTEQNGGTQYYDASGKSQRNCDFTSAKTLYAYWTAIEYKVVYNSNKPGIATGTVSGATDDSSHVYDTPKNLSANGYSLVGWTFKGWATTKNGAVKYEDGAEVTNLTSTANGTYTLYAVWEANTYTVKYDSAKPNGASGTVRGATSDSTHSYDTASEISANGYSLNGWTFKGWSKIKGGEIDYAPDSVLNNLTATANGIYTLYAVWEANTYTVKYDFNKPANASGNAVGDTEDSIHVYDTERKLSANGYSLVGWTFKGWAETAIGAIKYADGENVINLTMTANGTYILYAVWEANIYNISFDTAGGSYIDSISVRYDSEITKTAGLPVRKGYNFNGYFTGRDGAGAKYFNADGTANNVVYKTVGGTVLYAYWTPIRYNIELYSQGKYVKTLSNVVYGSMNLPSAEDLGLFRENYNFVGWNLYDDQNWSMYNANTVYNTGIAGAEGETVTLYAAWLEKDRFTINFDANGGTGAPAMGQAHEDETIVLSSVVPSRKNYTFLGWATDAGAQTAQYQPGDRFTMGKAVVTLYAVWKLNPSLTYDANGGAFTVPAERVYPAAGETVIVASFVPVLEGHVFDGWSEDSEAVSATYRVGESFVMPDTDTVFYAVWKKAQYSVTFDVAEGYSVTGLSGTYYYGEEVTFEVAGNLPKVYVNGQRIEAGANKLYTFILNGDTHVAVADGSKLSLIYSANGGTNAPWDNTAYDAETSATVSSSEPDRLGYTFIGWATDANAEQAEYTAGEVFNLSGEDAVLYAVWQANVYTISYDKNGGEGVMTDDPFSYGTAGALTQNAYERAGYTFMGWAVSADGAVVYGDGANVSDLCTQNGGNVILYAVWERTVTVISFYSEDGTTVNAPISVAYGDPLSSAGLVAPTRIGYIFAGYGTQPGGAGELIFDADLNVVYVNNWDKNVLELTLYPQWKPISYTVVYINGQNVLGRISAVYGVTFDLSLAETLGITVPGGYHFAGWATIPSAQIATYTDGQTIADALTLTDGDEVFLYAVFAVNEKYSVVYNANGGINAPVDDNKYYEGETVTFGNVIPKLEGYVFAGWSYDPNSTTVDFPYEDGKFTKESSVAMPKGGLLLYAVWTPGDTLQAQINRLKETSESLKKSIAALESADVEFNTKLEKLVEDLEDANTAISSLEGKITATNKTLADEVSRLEGLITQAEERLQAAINQVQANLDKAVSDLTKTIGDNKTDIEGKLAEAKKAYEDADAVINGNLGKLSEKLASEVSRLENAYKAADDKLQAAINQVQANLDKAVSDLTKTIGDNKTDIEGKLAEAEKAYKAADAVINGNLGKLSEKLASEVSRLEDAYKEADSKLQAAIDQVQANLDKAVDDLTKTINANKTDIESKLAEAKKAYEDADAVINGNLGKLSEKLASEVSRLEGLITQAEERLQAAINQVQANLDKAVSDLTKTIGDNKTDIEGKLAEAKKAYEDADAVINGNLGKLSEKLASEVSRLENAYKAADSKLQTAIDQVQANLDKAVSDLTKTINANKTDIEGKLAEAKKAYEDADAVINGNLGKLSEKLASEVSRLEDAYKAADDKLQAAINQVQANLDKAVNDLTETINANKTDIEKKLAEAEKAYKAADAVLRTDFENKDSELEARIAALEEAYKAADEAIWAGIRQVQANLDAAKNQLEEKDNELESRLNSLRADNDRNALICLIAGIILAVAVLTLIVIQAVKAFKKKQQE